MSKYLISLGITVAVECLLTGVQSRNRSWVMFIFWINVLTNPIANLLYNGTTFLMDNSSKQLVAVAIEAAVVISETLLIFAYRKKERHGLKAMSLGRCLLYAFDLNMISYLAGWLLNSVAVHTLLGD